MRVAVLSDIHGVLPALETVLAETLGALGEQGLDDADGIGLRLRAR